jgi:hypothetical protein
LRKFENEKVFLAQIGLGYDFKLVTGGQTNKQIDVSLKKKTIFFFHFLP